MEQDVRPSTAHYDQMYPRFTLFSAARSFALNPILIRTRSFARKAGLIHLINRLRPHVDYEKRVHEILAKTVKQGDVVWDVGANVGLYTELFCQWVGDGGWVVAFEPWSGSCEQIRERLPQCAWLRIENIALGAADDEGYLIAGADSTQNHLGERSGAGDSEVDAAPVAIRRGDTVRERLGTFPNVIKIDVEGFEVEVLMGMTEVLASTELRSVLVEVHFQKLEARGNLMAPRQIEAALKSNGLKTRWVDSSHLFAER